MEKVQRVWQTGRRTGELITREFPGVELVNVDICNYTGHWRQGRSDLVS